MAIFLAEGEQVIREYRCAKVDFVSADGGLEALGIGRRRPDTDCTVTVTNRRVIYFAESERPSKGTSMPSMHSQEAFVDRITSMEFLQADVRRRYLVPLLISIVGLVVTLMALYAGDVMYLIPGIAVLAFGLAIFVPAVLTTRPMMLMRIGTQSSDSGICVTGLSRREEEVLSFYMVPNEEFARMSSEIGALVLDLQGRGDACIPDWKGE